MVMKIRLASGIGWPTPLMNSCPVVLDHVYLVSSLGVHSTPYMYCNAAISYIIRVCGYPNVSLEYSPLVCRPRRSGSLSACIRANRDRGEQRQILRPFRAGALIRGYVQFHGEK